MRYLLRLCVSFFLASHLVHAHDETPIGTTYDGIPIVPRPQYVYADSSTALRQNREFYASIGAGIIGVETRLGYFLFPDLRLDLSFTYQEDLLTGISRSMALAPSFFVADTLYLRAGLAHRWGDSINYVNSFAGDPGIKLTSDSGMIFGIGNQWQFATLNVGAEWVSIYVPLIGNDQDVDFQFRLVMVSLGVSL